MNISEIQDLIKFVSKSGVTEVEIEQKDFKMKLHTEILLMVKLLMIKSQYTYLLKKKMVNDRSSKRKS